MSLRPPGHGPTTPPAPAMSLTSPLLALVETHLPRTRGSAGDLDALGWDPARGQDARRDQA
jgi:hypothetical protein